MDTLENWFGDLSGIPDGRDTLKNKFFEPLKQKLPNAPLQCPYCLFEARINDWLIPKQRGLGHLEKSVQCPRCKAIQRRENVIKLTIGDFENYANWLYWTAKYDVDRKVKWSFIFERMKGTNFWEIYRAVKKRNIEAQYAKPDISESEPNPQNPS